MINLAILSFSNGFQRKILIYICVGANEGQFVKDLLLWL